MSKIRSMYAGSGGTAHGINRNGPGQGNNKWGGAPSTTNVRSGLVNYILTHANASPEQREQVFFFRPMAGGVGAKSSQHYVAAGNGNGGVSSDAFAPLGGNGEPYMTITTGAEAEGMTLFQAAAIADAVNTGFSHGTGNPGITTTGALNTKTNEGGKYVVQNDKTVIHVNSAGKNRSCSDSTTTQTKNTFTIVGGKIMSALDIAADATLLARVGRRASGGVEGILHAAAVQADKGLKDIERVLSMAHHHKHKHIAAKLEKNTGKVCPSADSGHGHGQHISHPDDQTLSTSSNETHPLLGAHNTHPVHRIVLDLRKGVTNGVDDAEKLGIGMVHAITDSGQKVAAVAAEVIHNGSHDLVDGAGAIVALPSKIEEGAENAFDSLKKKIFGKRSKKTKRDKNNKTKTEHYRKAGSPQHTHDMGHDAGIGASAISTGTKAVIHYGAQHIGAVGAIAHIVVGGVHQAVHDAGQAVAKLAPTQLKEAGVVVERQADNGEKAIGEATSDLYGGAKTLVNGTKREAKKGLKILEDGAKVIGSLFGKHHHKHHF